MKVDKIFRVGIFLCRIKRSFFAEYFNAWASKIDPFLDTPGESGRIITISSKKGWKPQIVKILRRTHLGFFEGRITEDAERIVYLQIAAYYGQFCGAKRPQCGAERPGFLLI